jgi:hypothetical protein
MTQNNAPSPDDRGDHPMAPLEGQSLPHKEADDRDQVFYEGSPLLRGELGHVLLWFALGALLIAAPFILSGPIGWALPGWLWIALIAGGLICIAVPVIVLKRVRYRITNYRIDFERGLFSKRIDTLELWHVDDLRFYQNLINRILRVGEIVVLSGDATTPNLRLRAVPNPRPLFEMLKQRVIAVKRQRGVIKMDLG